MRWTGIFLFFLFVAGNVAQAKPAAQNQTAEQDVSPRFGYFVDASAQMTLADVKTQTFKPFRQALSLGYTDSRVWLRLHIDPDLGRDESQLDSNRLVLRLTNPLLNDVRLYDPLQNNGMPIVTGDAYPNTPTELDLSSLTFFVPRGGVGSEIAGEYSGGPANSVGRDVYVSVQTTSSMVFSVVLEPVEAALKHNRTYDLFAGLYLGLLVVFLVLAIALRVGRADLVTNWFILQQAMAIVWSLTLMGYTRQYIEPLFGWGSVDGVSNLIVVFYTFTVCQYALLFLRQFKLSGWLKSLVYWPSLVFVPLLALVIVGQSGLALSVNAMAVIGFSFLGLVIVLTSVDWEAETSRILPRWLVTFFYVLFGVAGPLATSVTLRVEPLFQNAFVGFFFTTALAGVLMSTLLLYRARMQARDAVAAATALRLQQQRSQEQAKFLGMLAHEFKTPLSIIKMVTGSGQLDAKSTDYSSDAIRNIDALLEKCLQAEALMDAKTVSEPVVVNVQALAHDVVTHSERSGQVDIDSSGLTEIRSDPTLVRIILANLVDNALKYGKPGIEVQLQVTAGHGGEVLVRVTSAVGPAGVPDPLHVFDKYYRSPAALSQSGSGLGLYLSKHIAQLLGGDLIFEPSQQTLAFELRLPGQL